MDSMFNVPLQYMLLDTCRVAYRIVGQGDPLVFITGWPFHHYTYHNIVSYLADKFTCILIDSPGLGQTVWTEKTDFSFPGQAKTFEQFLDKLDIDRYHLLAHNTGATIARLMVADNLHRVLRFVILNTEIPHERPPWFPLYAQLMKIPGNGILFRQFLRSQLFLKSPMGFGGCYHDSTLINETFKNRYVQPLIEESDRLEGASRYLRIGLDFKLIDALSEIHRKIIIPVYFIWGASDPTFPIQPARQMMTDFPNCYGMKEIPNGNLLSHEEFPKMTSDAIRAFLS